MPPSLGMTAVGWAPRGAARQVHRWVGLSLTLFLIVVGLTGSLLAFRGPLDAWLNPALYAVPSGHAALDAVVLLAKLEARLPHGASVSQMPLAVAPAEPAVFWVRPGETRGDNQYFVEPGTGRLLGSRRFGDLDQGKKNFVPFVLRLHSSLALKGVGAQLLGVVALLWLLDCFVAAALTLPPGGVARWGSALRVKVRSVPALLFAGHRALGVWVWPALLVFAWSGVALNFSEVHRAVVGAVLPMQARAVEGLSRLDTPRVHPSLSYARAREEGRHLMRTLAQQRGFSVIDERRLSYDPSSGVYRYQGQSSLDVSSSYPSTTVWFDGETGVMRAFEAPTGHDAGNTLTSWLYHLHFGSIGSGSALYRACVSLVGLFVAALAASGAWIWWRRRQKRERARLRAGPAAVAVLVTAAVLGWGSEARADTIVAVMSEASAPQFAAAADTFERRSVGHRLLFRSTAQVARATDTELRALVAGADTVILAAVFGDEVGRLLAALQQGAPQTLVPLHGDSRFMAFARVRGALAFPGMTDDQAASALRELASQPFEAPAPGADATPQQVLVQARRYRDARDTDNLANLFMWLTAPPTERARVPPPVAGEDLRFVVADRALSHDLAGLTGSVVALMDYDYGDQAGDRDIHRSLCEALASRHLGCVSVLARWGQPSIDALHALRKAATRGDFRLTALVQLQDFVVGGGVDAKAAAAALEALDVPAIKAVRLADRSVSEWRVSEDGLPDNSVHYRLAMPELQGAGQPFVVAAAGPRQTDALTGLELQPLSTLADEIESLAERLSRWERLATKPNAEKRVAIVYYNHPPGRHNIGADNLDVPASLLSVLRRLKAAGYTTGTLPDDDKALLDLLQERGVNLPEDGQALAKMSKRIAHLSGATYRKYFEGLPGSARRSLEEGPLGGLLALAASALEGNDVLAVDQRIGRVIGDVRHLVEGAVHPERARALELIEALEKQYAELLAGNKQRLAQIELTCDKLRRTGIEGLSGWGPPPGKIMTHHGDLLVPGLTFGNIFVGPQPPRGWELNEELLHANLAFPPPHQYLAFYEYLRTQHRADAVVHLGRHSTYEFLPGRRTGLGGEDFPRIVVGYLPSVYLYIVDGVGEGIQAKRRGQAVIVDHLTPSLSTTPLYDELLALRQLVESYEAGAGVKGHAGERALSEIRSTIERLHLRDELTTSMAPELKARGIGFDEVDGELLVHEVGHYLTQLQERFMPHGLHVFARPWPKPAVERMLASMAGEGQRPDPAWRSALEASPTREAEALLAALDGRFVAAGPGNDPVRTPEVLPTGRNFHALDASVLPTRLGYKLGAGLAAQARSSGSSEGSEAVVLWASDTVRDEGAMVAFGLDMLGVTPVWNSRGIVRGLERLPLEGQRARRDTAFVTSGLFRDLYGHLIEWLDRAVLVALDGSSETLSRDYPDLQQALVATLAPLGADRAAGSETLEQNPLAAQWALDARAYKAEGAGDVEAGVRAAARVFGDAPGSYGAGINRLAERSGAWQSRAELSRSYVRRIGHAYGGGRAGKPAQAAFKHQLARTGRTYLGRASNLYGLLDNNDVFDYLGGLGMAVEAERGTPPEARVVQHADPKAAHVQALPSALMQELRGRHLNPNYLKPLMAHGYAGARTMGSGFIENLWGWQVTSPHIVRSWVWDEAKAVYLDDKHGIGLSEFLSEGQNVHVKTNIQAVFLVAAHKGFWQADEQVLQELSEAFARAVVEHGLPGSGHTRPDHPLMADVKQRLDPALAASFQAALDSALGASARAVASELQSEAVSAESVAEGQTGESSVLGDPPVLIGLGLLGLLLLGGGYLTERARRHA